MVLVRRPFSARIDGNAGGQRGREEFLRIDLIRQFDPEKNAAFRTRLCFANPSHETIRAAVAALAEVCRREFGVPARIANVERARA